jgi:3-dehydroquinate synthase
MKQVRVKTTGGTYPVIVGSGLSAPLRTLLKKQVGRGRLFVGCDADFYVLHGQKLVKEFLKARVSVVDLVVPAGEKAKTPRALAGVYDFLLGEKITRDDFVLAIGGGTTSDLIGYAAATTMRGLRWGVVPTTLMGMVDAAIGGKTGINHERGKNLIGAFWQPSLVCCDVSFLTTLPERQLRAGLGEVVKTVGLAGLKQTAVLDRYMKQEDLYDNQSLADLVHLCVAYKSKVVGRDERDRGDRLVLNFGHTFGHGIEKALGYGKLLHGEAVLIGIEAALALGERLGYDSNALGRYRAIVSDMLSRLPRYRIDAEQVWQAMALDKKRSATNLRYVILKDQGRPFVSERVKSAMARAALEEALLHYRQVGGRYA